MQVNNKSITQSHGMIVVAQLTEEERTLLRDVTIGHGKLIAAAMSMGVSRQTVYTAMYGGSDLSVDTLNAIRTFLQSQKVA